jgi:hypothetical protein
VKVEPQEPQARPTQLRWWREVIYIALFYGVYTIIRDTQGSAGKSVVVPSITAFHHAKQVISIERHLWLFHERALQHAFAEWPRFFYQVWNVYYGSAHFVVTAAAIIWMFHRQPARYTYWRNVLAIATGLALIGFAAYPLMPPRLLPSSYGFVDSLKHYGGLWSFDSGAMAKVSNQYAAMPSLHFAWSTYCACVFLPACKQWWTKALTIAYPIATLFAIVLTANHYFLDAAAGAAVLGVAVLVARPVTKWIPT